MILQENWKPVVGYEKYYEVSDCGNVKSLRSGKLRKLVINRQNGYYMVFLCGDIPKEKKCVYVHRLVAQAFCDKTSACECVNHKDHDRTNNRADNLEWCTYQYNNEYSRHLGKNDRIVERLDENGNVIELYPSMREAGRRTNTEYKNIFKVCNGERKHAGGYRWRYYIERNDDLLASQ